jgi:hypothetical protein
MTEAEKKAVLLLGDAWNAMLACGVSGPEPAAYIHALQHAVMARTAQRLHPEIFRQDPRDDRGPAPPVNR